ncbi:MAG: hypothetical protein MI757_02610 [Pirellulales bacterium]|nr:hypothetical protein [Pirellulales bacterium]
MESQGDGNRAIVAPIRDGRYRFDDDRGHSGGRYRVRIVHIPDSNEATGVVEPLWFDPWQDRIDLPAEHVERDFKLPNPERASRLR